MGDVYINNGQASAMGRNAKAIGTSIYQDNRKTMDHLDEKQLQLLNKFLERLVNEETSEMKKPERLAGATHLASIIDAAGSEQVEKKEEALSQWHNWLTRLKEPAQRYLAVTADVVTLGLPLLKLLGLSSI